MNASMRALVTDGHGGAEVMDVPVPARDDWVVVESRVAGICGTDTHLIDGRIPGATAPLVLGHEGAGVVAYVPPGVTGLTPGDRVTLFSTLQGRHAPGQLGFSLPGTFADYWSAPAANLALLPDAVPFELGALLGCAGLTALHAFRRSGVAEGQSIAVHGIGGVGLMLVQLAAARGAHVTVIADATEKAGLATDAGAGRALVVADDDDASLVARLRECTDGTGFDHYFDLVGSAATLGVALEALADEGTAVVLSTTGESLIVDPVRMLTGQFRLIGSLAGTWEEFHEVVDLAAQGALRAQIDQRYALDQAGVGLDLVRSRRSLGRNLIVW